jgi:hypothetical protein
VERESNFRSAYSSQRFSNRGKVLPSGRSEARGTTEGNTLTQRARPSSLIGMRFARQGLVAALTIAIAAYAVDCIAASPQQSMQCCQYMRCSSHGHHDNNCCKTMPLMKVALGQPSSVQGLSLVPLTLGVVETQTISSSLDLSSPRIMAHSHAPPIFLSPPLLPLRI